MPILTQAEYQIGDMLVRYQAPADRPEAWGLCLLPADRHDHAVAPREWLDSPAIRQLPSPWNQTRAWEVDPLVHAHLSGDVLPGAFSQGRTLRNSATTGQLTVVSHTREALPHGAVRLVTVVAHPRGLRCTHELVAKPGEGNVTIRVTTENAGSSPLTLDYLSAFSLGGLTPFASDDAAGQLWVHRFRSAWSAEGRLDSQPVEALLLERSWTGHAARSERFGQSGSLPVNGWFPWVALEDRGAGVTWAAQLATPGSWHLEVYRRADQLALSGGGADRLSGEWRKTLAPGESWSAPPARLTVCTGNLDAACDRLLAAARVPAQPQPPSEKNLPIVFNEWCTSWGNPTHASVVALADRLAGTGVRYLVIDDGWAERPGNHFQQNGDWRGEPRAFSRGFGGHHRCDPATRLDPRTVVRIRGRQSRFGRLARNLAPAAA